MRQLNDETLEGLVVAYLDNHLDAEERILVQGLKTGRDDDGKRFLSLVQDLEVDFRPAQDALEGLSLEPPTQPHSASLSTRFARSPLSQLALAAVVALMVFGAGLWAGRGWDDAGMSWQESIAAYQALYGPNTLQGIALSEEERLEGLALAQTFVRFADPDLTALSKEYGLEFRRAQILEDGGLPIAQLVFADQQGQAFALCISPADDGFDSQQRSSFLSGLNTRSWQEKGLQYMLVGKMDTAKLVTMQRRLFAS